MIDVKDLILNKDIDTAIPINSEIDSRVLSRLLDENKVVASYKMYWLMGILDEVSLGHTEIEFRIIIARMITYSWYPHMQYKLSFGAFDNLKKPISYIAAKYGFSSNCDENKLLKFICNTEDKELKKMLKELSFKVPYRLISPFFKEELRGIKDSLKDNIITKLSLINEICLYKIIKGKENKIVINDCWKAYLRDNYKLIKAWIYYKLVCFLQKRNPNIPAIVFKLEAPKSRKLTTVTKLWKHIINIEGVTDIYTGEEFSNMNFQKFGVLSIDHFIPWSFVLHDKMWNLVPTFKNINSVKSNNLLSFDKYIEDFCSVQYKAFSYICDNKLKNSLEDYMDILRLDNPYDYYKHSNREKFVGSMKQCISPLYQIAVNQGFEVVNKLL